LEASFVLLEFSSPSRRIFIGSHSLPPSLVHRIGPSKTELGFAPVRPVRGTGQTGVACALEMNSTYGSTPANPTPDLPNRSTDLRKTLGIVETPRGVHSQDFVQQNLPNQEESKKSRQELL
jgi:hypothetical protein